MSELGQSVIITIGWYAFLVAFFAVLPAVAIILFNFFSSVFRSLVE